MLGRVNVRAPDGWPGIVGIVVLVAGMAGMLGRPGVTPLLVPTEELGGYLSAFAFAWPSGPGDPIAIDQAADAYAAADGWTTDLGSAEYAERHQTLIGLFEDVDSMRAAFADVDLPDGTTMFSVGRLILVSGIATGEPAPVELAEPFLHASQGLIEGDRGGEGSIVLDLRCTAPSDDAAADIAQAIGDYGAVPYYAYLRPPWHGAPLTADEELARVTYRRWTQAYADTLRSDPYFADWARRFSATDSTAEREALQDELNQHVLEQTPTLGDEVHPGVMAILAHRPLEGDPDGYVEWGLALGRQMGLGPMEEGSVEPSWFDQRHAGSIGSVRAVQRTVEIGWASFNTFALGGLGLLAYLHDHGCADGQITLSDFDDVRGD